MFACGHGVKQTAAPPKVVPYADLKKYIGTWYEIARFKHRFDKGCFPRTATYTLLEGRKTEDVNHCRKGSLDGEISPVKGNAWVLDRETNGWRDLGPDAWGHMTGRLWIEYQEDFITLPPRETQERI